jgi:hypothetical protein
MNRKWLVPNGADSLVRVGVLLSHRHERCSGGAWKLLERMNRKSKIIIERVIIEVHLMSLQIAIFLLHAKKNKNIPNKNLEKKKKYFS